MVDRTLSSPASGIVDRPASLQIGKPDIANLTPELDSERIVAELRAKIDSRQPGGDPIEQIVEAARSVTGAHGVAVAMRQKSSVFCTARAGYMAPDLGTELSPDSGISGECLRTGRVLCCGDTHTDTRVDQDACRRLGLRSLVVAPVGNRSAVSGILEAFSPELHAFSDTHVQRLVELAELVMAAQAARTKPLAIRIQEKLVPATRNWKIIASAAAVLALVGWFSFRGKGSASHSSHAAPPAVSVSVAPVPANQPSEVLAKPAPGISSRHAKAGLPPGVVMARTSEKTRSESRIESAAQPKAGPRSNAETSPIRKLASPAVRNPDDVLAAAPSLSVVPADPGPSLAGILPSSSALPVQSSVKISQGVTGGTVDRRVDPIYPPQARSMRLEGRVVLQGVVTEEGTMRDLKVIDGNQLLARAAMDAVAQWHFKPYRLNGQPIQMTTDIVLLFKLP